MKMLKYTRILEVKHIEAHQIAETYKALDASFSFELKQSK